jgi:plasmid stabilization system protein ParE
MASLRIIAAARAEYAEAFNRYRNVSEHVAFGFEAAVQQALESVANSPEAWPFHDEPHRVYKVKRYPYLIIYSFEPDQGVTVLVIAHAHRRPGYWKYRTRQ